MAEKQIASMEDGITPTTATATATATTRRRKNCERSGLLHCPNSIITISQKLIAEVVGTYFIIFLGCGSVVVNKTNDGMVTFPGICMTWGLAVTVMIYSLGHISGGHFNPAVTITFAIFQAFPSWEVPLYIAAQVLGSVLASGTLLLVMKVTPAQSFGTVPAGTNVQSLIMEIIISFLLMFVIQGACNDRRANGRLGGIVVGMTILANVMIAGPISGASMNPARSTGPAVIMSVYDGLWVYYVGPIVGMVSAAFVYNMIRGTEAES